jgi:hypothetical protein
MLAGQSADFQGSLVRVIRGVPRHTFIMRNSSAVFGVSCPSRSGCVALDSVNDLGPFGLSRPGIGAMLTMINGSGRPSRTVGLNLPEGVVLSRIACTSLHHCELAGLRVVGNPIQIVFSTWTGHGVHLRHVTAPSGALNPSLGQLACSGSSCYLTGYVQRKGGPRGFVIHTSGGRPAGTHLLDGDSLYGVSCSSSSSCWVGGGTSSGGVIIPLQHGNLGTPITTSAAVNGLTCHRTGCFGAGVVQVAPTPAINYGAIVTLSSGRITGTQLVPDSAGFASIDSATGRSFAAVGPGNPASTEVTTG